MTQFVILKKTAGGWVEAGKAEAPSRQSAISKTLDSISKTLDGDSGGEFVAVPSRSWRPITAKFETKVKFG